MKKRSLKALMGVVLAVILIISCILIVNAADSNLISHWKLEADGINSVAEAGDFVVPDTGVEFVTVDGQKGLSITRGTVIYRHNWGVNIGSNSMWQEWKWITEKSLGS